MSDFDKEAEREKLREKFEKDREKRQHTQDLSELLLKGATMTNRHCGRCGDPIFRHDGQEFCPTCGTDDPEVANEAAPQGGGTGSRTDASTPADGEPTARGAPPDERSEGTYPDVSAEGTDESDADVAAARASLARAVTTSAERAAAAEDPRRAREHLEAAREAAEALAALR